MTIAITVDPTFKKLNDDPSYLRKPGGIGRERETVVDIVITAETPAAGGLLAVDFSQTGIRFTQVYICQIIHNDFNGLVSFVPATGNDAATGELHFVDFAGADDTSLTTTTLKAIIRGI